MLEFFCLYIWKYNLSKIIFWELWKFNVLWFPLNHTTLRICQKRLNLTLGTSHGSREERYVCFRPWMVWHWLEKFNPKYKRLSEAHGKDFMYIKLNFLTQYHTSHRRRSTHFSALAIHYRDKCHWSPANKITFPKHLETLDFYSVNILY